MVGKAGSIRFGTWARVVLFVRLSLDLLDAGGIYHADPHVVTQVLGFACPKGPEVVQALVRALSLMIMAMLP